MSTEIPTDAERCDAGEQLMSALYRCIACGTHIDETEYSDPRDADICGYCFASAMTLLRKSHIGFPERELQIRADVQIRLDAAHSKHDAKEVEIYERIIRLLEA